MTPPTPIIVITPEGQTGLADWRELWSVRDLWQFLVRRDIKTRYAQSVLGLGWAIVQPLFTMGVLTLIFGKLANLPSDGVPYAVWSLTAVVAWTFFQAAVNEAGNSLGANLGVITKVYFPRLVLPLAAVTGKLFDLAIMLGLLAVVLVANRHAPGIHPQLSALWFVPAALALTFLAALAMGLWLAALSVQYRDVRVAQSFLMQLLMYISPVIYSLNKVPDDVSLHFFTLHHFHRIYFCNPLASVIETMRATLLGVEPYNFVHLARHLLLGTVVTLITLYGGIRCFHRAARIVADVA